MATDLHDQSIAELSNLIAARKLSPVELVEALIQRVEQYDNRTHAFITRTFDLARRQAKQAEAEIAAGRPRGPLHGIPFGLKDIYDTKGILTSAHSRIFYDVKIIIAESEIFSVHQKDLIARPGQFGADFRARALPAVLFSANDYSRPRATTAA